MRLRTFHRYTHKHTRSERRHTRRPVRTRTALYIPRCVCSRIPLRQLNACERSCVVQQRIHRPQIAHIRCCCPVVSHARTRFFISALIIGHLSLRTQVRAGARTVSFPGRASVCLTVRTLQLGCTSATTIHLLTHSACVCASRRNVSTRNERRSPFADANVRTINARIP